MGQAKQRGSFEERKLKAIDKGKLLKPAIAAPVEHQQALSEILANFNKLGSPPLL